jgi:hypothetical protein
MEDTIMLPVRTSMKRALLFVCLCFATLLFAADNPWKSKPYQNWNAKDLQAIMTDSPWVHVDLIRRSWVPAQRDVVPQQIVSGIRHTPNASGAVQTNTEASNRQGEASLDQLNVYIYWYSSRLIRAASAREAVLHGVMDQSSVQKFVDAPRSEYQVAVRMDDMTPFIQKDESFYQRNVFLEMRRSKLRLPPSKVVYERGGTADVKDVIFFFPKAAGGTPTIGSDETDVMFTLKIADQTLRADFKPKKMVDQFGADL